MHVHDGRISLSASDLTSFLACRRKTALDHAAAHGRLQKPDVDDYVLNVLRERGAAHEKRYLETIRATCAQVIEPAADTRDRGRAAARTLEAMRRGDRVIAQGALLSRDSQWYGIADVLLR